MPSTILPCVARATRSSAAVRPQIQALGRGCQRQNLEQVARLSYATSDVPRLSLKKKTLPSRSISHKTFTTTATTQKDKSFRDQIGQGQQNTAPAVQELGDKDAKKKEKNFHGQVWQSMYERVQREKEDEKKYQGQGYEMQGGRAFGFLFVSLFAGGMGYWAGSLGDKPEDTSSTIPLENAIPPVHNTSRSNLQTAWVELRDIVGETNISEDEFDRTSHAGSEWSSHQLEAVHIPFAVVRPSTTAEVSQIMKICHARQIPVTAYSGGTSLEGHFAATRGGICIDFSRMDNILAINKSDLDCTVQPAVGWEALNEDLAEQGLFFPPDPGPGAQIGGMIGTGCSGTNAYRYGTMKDWVLGLTVVLADGSVIRTRQRPRKSSAGYDLTRVFVGSEGTLGLVTEATLRLTPKPIATSVAVCSFPSIRLAADCVSAVVEAGVPIAAIEILDDVQMRCINDAGITSRAWKEAPTLFFKFAGTPSGIKEHIGLVRGFAKASKNTSFEFAKSDAEAAELWSARKEALWSVMAKRRDDGDHVWTTDVAVPISRLPRIIEETKEDIRSSRLFGSIVGHVGDGNFHSILLYNSSEREIAEGVVHRMVARAIELEGTATGEHGVGLVKRDALPFELGTETVDAMRKLKKAFDPLCLLNCDKVVRVQKPAKGAEVVDYSSSQH